MKQRSAKGKPGGALDAGRPPRGISGDPPPPQKITAEAPLCGLTPLPVFDPSRARQPTGAEREWTAHLVRLVIAEFAEYRESLEAALARRDVAALRAQVHRLGGGAAFCGAFALPAACSETEHALQRGTLGEIRRALDALLREMDRMEHRCGFPFT